VLLLEPLGVLAQGLGEAAVVEHGRPQGAHQVAQHPGLLAEPLLDPLQHLVGRLQVLHQPLAGDPAQQVADPLAGPVDVVVEDGELLHGPVVKVVGDPGPLVLGSLQDPAEQAPTLVLHRHLAGQALGAGDDQQEHDDAAGGDNWHLDRSPPGPFQELDGRGEDGGGTQQGQAPAGAPERDRSARSGHDGHGWMQRSRPQPTRKAKNPASIGPRPGTAHAARPRRTPYRRPAGR
jgi:hypothetical protein